MKKMRKKYWQIDKECA